jgi:hypothetical protein
LFRPKAERRIAGSKCARDDVSTSDVEVWKAVAMAKKDVTLIPAERIERAILWIRGQKVMLDSDLAALYGVSTGAPQ